MRRLFWPAWAQEASFSAIPTASRRATSTGRLFCTEKAIGRPKAEVCREGVLSIASYMEVEAHVTALDENTLPGFLKNVDFVMDCLDSVARKKMLEEQAKKAGVPCVQGSVARNEGLALFDSSFALPFSKVYPEEISGNTEGAAMNTHVLTVAGTAALMVSLLIEEVLHGQERRRKAFSSRPFRSRAGNSFLFPLKKHIIPQRIMAWHSSAISNGDA